MAINRLQIRRDQLGNFQTSSFDPLIAEPAFILNESRIRVFRDRVSPVGRVPVALPQAEGSQFHAVWNCRAFGTGNALTVPAMNGSGYYSNGTSTMDPLFTAFSGALPRYFARDAGVVEVTASGDFLPGSTHPAMLFAFAIGDLEGNNEVVIGTQPGSIFQLAIGTNETQVNGRGYLEVGPGVGMRECLGDYDRPVLWNLEAKVCFMGRSSISPFRSSLSLRGDLAVDSTDGVSDWEPADAVFRSDADIEDTNVTGDDDNANVRIYGTLRIMDPFVTYGNNRTMAPWYAGSGTPNTVAPFSYRTVDLAGLDWSTYTSASTDYPSSLGRGVVVAHMGRSFESKGVVPGTLWADMTAGTADAKVNALVSALGLQSIMEPGRGTQWERWFRPRETVVNFSMEEYVPNLNTEETQFLKLKVGGPMQSNTDYTYPSWTAAPGGGQFFQAADLQSNPGYVSAGAGMAGDKSRMDYLPASGATSAYSTARNLQNLCRRITPDGGTAADYVCRYPHTLFPSAASDDLRLADIVSVSQSSAGTDKNKWYYTDPEAVGNADGEWNCAWRRLADDRRDRMRIHHSTAYAFGGRPGTNDYRPS